ncbi:hypothetical protein VCHENC03_4695 [Vibrio sp. HENC-03]|nr:hypothetical protein VCHENC03_4695 [Vibrio sp. HENC-03]
MTQETTRLTRLKEYEGPSLCSFGLDDNNKLAMATFVE